MFARVDRLWQKSCTDAEYLTVIFILVGIFLAAASFVIGLHSVEWNGNVSGAKVEGLKVQTKQVGYLWAPNWGLTGVVLLPLALYNISNARASVESTLLALVNRNMIVSRDFTSIDEVRIITAWKLESKRYTILAILVFVSFVLFILIFDFYGVVLNWLIIDTSRVSTLIQDPIHRITINHSQYEFDWSISALFDNSQTTRVTNAVFSATAYLFIAMIGPGLILANFIWFPSICSFFTRSGLIDGGFTIIPDVNSKDIRGGFEVFEPLFNYLVISSIFTSLMAVAMHLQNVYLRSPNEENIVHMIFGDATQATSKAWNDMSFKPVYNFLTSVDKEVEVDIHSLSLQTYAAPFVFMLITCIVVFYVWFWLRRSASNGIVALTRNGNLTDENRLTLQSIRVWPLGWISLNILLLILLLVFFSMWYVNSLALLLAFFGLKAAEALWSSIIARRG